MQSRFARITVQIAAIAILASVFGTSRLLRPAPHAQEKTKRALTLENIVGGGRGGGARGATISPDGKSIVIGTDGASGAGNYVWSPATNERTFWFQGNIAAWFPDSQRVVVSRENDLWVLPVGSNDAKRVTNDQQDEREAAVSPDGKWIAFK